MTTPIHASATHPAKAITSDSHSHTNASLGGMARKTVSTRMSWPARSGQGAQLRSVDRAGLDEVGPAGVVHRVQVLGGLRGAEGQRLDARSGLLLLLVLAFLVPVRGVGFHFHGHLLDEVALLRRHGLPFV